MIPEHGEIYCGDCLEVMRQWPDGCIDAAICDPPYGINFMGKKWDYDVPGVETWAECLRVLKDGGRLLAFSGARTQHRMVCNIEDAGFTIEDCMMWIYGSGFPKHKSKLKPAYEPICVARKGSVTELQIDAARIQHNEVISAGTANSIRRGTFHEHEGYQRPWKKRDPERYAAKLDAAIDRANKLGRWPANVCFDEQAAREIDRQSGYSNETATSLGGNKDFSGCTSYNGSGVVTVRHNDSGGASRFFYCAKADKAERNAGCGALDSKPFAHSSGANKAIERGEDYTAGEGIGLNRVRPMTNSHPTVKPVDLMRWLIRLTVPEGGILLDPFFGSGTTGVAANREGVRWCGIELNPEYVTIAKARTAQQGLFTCE